MKTWVVWFYTGSSIEVEAEKVSPPNRDRSFWIFWVDGERVAIFREDMVTAVTLYEYVSD